jgi:hypothetical protein
MVSPGWRTRGVFAGLIKHTHQALRQDGCSLVLSWPNANSHAVQRMMGGYEDICQVPAMTMAADCAPKPAPHVPDSWRVPEQFPPEYDSLGAATLGKARYGVVRSSAYLSWRYGGRPDLQYYLFEERAAGKLRASVIWKLYPSAAPDRINVVEWLSDPDSFASVRPLRRLVQCAAEWGLPVLLWHNVFDYPRHSWLEQMGFRPSTPVFYFGVFPLMPEEALGRYRDWSQWYMTMGDVDIF